MAAPRFPTFRLADWELEPHVKRALCLAAAAADPEPVSAVHILQAVSLISSESGASSRAFSELARLLPGSMAAGPDEPVEVEELALSAPLARSLEAAGEFLETGVWGRDLVTLALLSQEEELQDYCSSVADTPLQAVRSEWFYFLYNGHDVWRSSEDWSRWWSVAGFVPPTQQEAFLLTWDVQRGDPSSLDYEIEDLESGRTASTDWRVGDDSRAHSGARVYLMRQQEPRGIVGSGVAVMPIHGPYQIGSQVKASKTVEEPAIRLRTHWDRLSNEPLVTLDQLEAHTGESDLWRTGEGGDFLSPEINKSIEDLLGEEVTEVPEDDASRFAQTLSDLDHSNDWIGIRPDVEALSTMVSVNRIEPPLSIAILGDWGSGKTFLMRKVQERVRLLEAIGDEQRKEAEAEGSTAAAERPRYCSSILQIEFNAWHYTESNLWASLVNHIFDRLQSKLHSAQPSSKSDAEREANIEELFRNLETAHAAREDAEQRIKLLKSEVNDAWRRRTSARTRLSDATASYGESMGQDAWAKIQALLVDGNSKQAQDLKMALKKFGFGDGLESAEAIYETVQQFRSVSGRAREVAGSLLATRDGATGALFVVLVTLGATLVGMKEGWVGAGLPTGAAIMSAMAWLSERALKARSWIEKIQAADEWLTPILHAERTRIHREVESARVRVEQAAKELSNAQKVLIEVQSREVTARADLKKLTARDQMRRFIDERVSSEAYRKHLGLVSMIRRDFEDLSDFMYRDKQEGEGRLVQRVEKAIMEDIPTIERIVLYIDDLDRCQPERVVEVLEAVHLLLAFRLFIVVVAVDPRWVFQALRIRYPHLVTPYGAKAEGGTNGNEASLMNHGAASTHDYIEKIFHIPLWVKPMTPNASKSLVAGYFDFAEEVEEKERKERKTSETAILGEAELEKYEHLSDQRQARSSTVTEQALDVDKLDLSAHGRKDREPDTKQAKEVRAAERAVQGVSISTEEQSLIDELAPHLGNSPRRIKRFANVYRLLKSGLSQQERRKFNLEGKGSGYQLVLVLLAIVTGAPILSTSLLAEIYRQRAGLNVKKLLTFVEKIEFADPYELHNAKGALSKLDTLAANKENIELWVPRVMRYSFTLVPVDVGES